jgi:hypothetical protein
MISHSPCFDHSPAWASISLAMRSIFRLIRSRDRSIARMSGSSDSADSFAGSGTFGLPACALATQHAVASPMQNIGAANCPLIVPFLQPLPTAMALFRSTEKCRNRFGKCDREGRCAAKPAAGYSVPGFLSVSPSWVSGGSSSPSHTAGTVWSGSLGQEARWRNPAGRRRRVTDWKTLRGCSRTSNLGRALIEGGQGESEVEEKMLTDFLSLPARFLRTAQFKDDSRSSRRLPDSCRIPLPRNPSPVLYIYFCTY